MGSDLRARARRAGFWALGGQALKAVIQVASVVVLARLLSPDDYGIFGMVMVFMALAGIFRELGLSGAAIQSQTLSESQRSNLWWINTLMGCSLMVLNIACAPLMAWLFAEPRLPPYLWGIAATLLLSAMGTQYSATLQRQLRFRELQIAGVSSQVIGLVVCIACAWAGLGTWALILQAIVNAVVSLSMVVWYCRWLPKRWDRSVPMQGFLRFGLSTLGYNLVMYLGNYVVNFATGRYFGTRELGALTRGTQLVQTPVAFLTQPISSLAFSSLSRVQQDKVRLARHAILWQQAVAYPVSLLCCGLVVVGPSLVPLALGDGWARSVAFVQLIAIATALGYAPMAAGWLFQSQGKPGVQLRMTLVFTPIRVVAVLIAAQHSVEALLVANVAVSMITWPITYAVLGRTTQVSARPLVVGVLRALATAAAPAAVLVGARAIFNIQWSPWIDLPFFGTAYLVLSAVLLVVPSVRGEVLAVVRVLRGKGV